MTEFPYDWLILELLRRVPRWVPRDWAFWVLLVSNTALTVTNVLYRIEAKKSQTESRISRQETILLRRDVRQLLAGNTPPMNIIQVPALYAGPIRNYDKGRGGRTPDLIILHGMGGTLTGTGSWFKNPLARASSHYGVGSPNADPEIDEVHQYVAVSDTAWGVRADSELKSANVRSVQIEIQNRDRKGNVWVKDSWYPLVVELVFNQCKAMNRRPDRSFIIAHREADPRKVLCPADIDVDRIVREAQVRWDAVTTQVPIQADFEPQKPEPGDIPAIHASVETMPRWVPFVQYSPVRVVTVTSEKGVNVRTSPEVRPDNLFTFQRRGEMVTAFPKGATFYAKGKVHGEAVSGGSNVWILTEGGRYVWAGATDYK